MAGKQGCRGWRKVDGGLLEGTRTAYDTRRAIQVSGCQGGARLREVWQLIGVGTYLLAEGAHDWQLRVGVRCN